MSERTARAEAALQAARTLTAPWATAVATPEPERLDVSVAATSLLAVVDALHSVHWGYLAAITGLDPGVASAALEVLYHFCTGPAVLTLRVRVSSAAAGVPSLCALIPSASFFERELSEMFGVTIENAPNTDRLFLPDDWPVGVYPLRKDFVVADG